MINVFQRNEQAKSSELKAQNMKQNNFIVFLKTTDNGLLCHKLAHWRHYSTSESKTDIIILGVFPIATEPIKLNAKEKKIA